MCKHTVNHLDDFGLLHIKAKGTHKNFQFVEIDGASLVGIEEFESFSQLLALIFGQLRALLLGEKQDNGRHKLEAP